MRGLSSPDPCVVHVPVSSPRLTAIGGEGLFPRRFVDAAGPEEADVYRLAVPLVGAFEGAGVAGERTDDGGFEVAALAVDPVDCPGAGRGVIEAERRTPKAFGGVPALV